MAHKVEIENIYNAVEAAYNNSDSDLHMWYYKLSDFYKQFNAFVEGACSDCADSDEVIVSRAVFASKLNTLINTTDEALAALTEFKNALPVLDDYWPVNIVDTTGLTNPTVSGE